MARAHAQPWDDAESERERTDERGLDDVFDDRRGDGLAGGGRRLYVPITSDMVERVVTIAPPIDAVVAAAYRAGGVATDPTTGWRRRSRISALVPTLSARAGQHEAWRDVLDPTVSHSVVLDVRASWHVERLVFDPNELRIHSLAVARRRERRRLAALTIQLYFDWVAARAAASRDVRAILDEQEKRAELDALTAGWFSQALANRAESQ